MNSPCRDFLSAMLETAPERPAAASALGAHFASCESCRQAFERMCRIRPALANLARLSAPAALDGLVVAATQAGQRQERALAHLRTALAPRKGRQEVPAGLDPFLGAAGSALLSGVGRVAAPAVLERLVEEELRDPQQALMRRYVSRLRRIDAPASLRTRVQQVLRAPRRSMGRRAVLAGAALVVLCAAMWGWWSLEHVKPRPKFQVVFVDDLNQLDPLALGMLAGLTGGVSAIKGMPR